MIIQYWSQKIGNSDTDWFEHYYALKNKISVSTDAYVYGAKMPKTAAEFVHCIVSQQATLVILGFLSLFQMTMQLVASSCSAWSVALFSWPQDVHSHIFAILAIFAVLIEMMQWCYIMKEATMYNSHCIMGVFACVTTILIEYWSKPLDYVIHCQAIWEKVVAARMSWY